MRKNKSGFRAIVNKKARFDYEVLQTLEAGVMLTGAEVKSLRMGRAQLKDSFARVMGGEVHLSNCHISAYKYARNDDYEPTRRRKLLLKRKEIASLQGKLKQKGLSLIPLKIYIKRGKFKVELGLVRGKKQYEKREKKKRQDVKREVERVVKAKYRG